MLHAHVIDELRTGGAQTHLVTVLREAVKYHGIQHHVVTLFGDGKLSQEIRDMGIHVHVLDLRPYFRNGRFLLAIGEVQRLLESLRPDLVKRTSHGAVSSRYLPRGALGCDCESDSEQGDLYMKSWKFRAGKFLRTITRASHCSVQRGIG